MAVTIYKKLQAIQLELKAPKSQYNSFGKYSYRNASDIMEALKPLLAKHGATAYGEKDYIEHIGDRYYLVAVIAFVDVETGEKITVEARAREEGSKKGMDGPQITGSASSYARKYALSGLFLIDDNKDVDSNEYRRQANQGNNQSKQTQQKQQNQAKKENNKTAYIDKNQYQVIVGLISELANVRNADFDTVFNWFLNKFQVKDVREILVTGYEIVCNGLKSQINKAKQGA